jgi:hypothetical protein
MEHRDRRVLTVLMVRRDRQVLTVLMVRPVHQGLPERLGQPDLKVNKERRADRALVDRWECKANKVIKD